MEYLRTALPHVYSRVVNASMSTYLWLSRNVGKMRRCLEVGFGYGALTTLLAKHCDEVYAVDVSFARVALLGHRARYEGLDNIYLALADATMLPFPDEYFDAVFMVGVLEWVPLSHEGNPRDVQLRALKEIRRVLRPGGELLVGIENRFGAQYFAGWKDHNGLRFTSILPRKFSDAISRILLKAPYRAYTYSYWGYKRLFADAGFEDVDIFLALRSYRFPRFAVLMERDDLHFFWKNVFIPTRKLHAVFRRVANILPTSIQQLFAPHFIIRGVKGGSV